MASCTKLKKCRVCSSSDLTEFLNFGSLSFSGIFPQTKHANIESGEVNLVFCNTCTQVQLGNIFNPNVMYGANYGYMSQLNDSMSNHLETISKYLHEKVGLSKEHTLVDIGSNDGTFLNFFTKFNLNLVGIDPTISKFHLNYSPEVKTIPNLFDENIFNILDESSVDVVTSIAMFYDLDDPIKFIRNIYNLLKPNGYLYLELTYGTWMQKSLAFDTICHEHAVYYSFTQLNKLFIENGFSIEDVFTNKSNGGSISILLQKKNTKSKLSDFANYIINLEKIENVNNIDSWIIFNNKTMKRIEILSDFFINSPLNKQIMGLGASTKGNILLQLLKITEDTLSSIGEINPDKFGKFTPGTNIPIIDEKLVLEKKPKQLLILPWHFKNNIISKQTNFLKNGGQLIFPLPNLEIISKYNTISA